MQKASPCGLLKVAAAPSVDPGEPAVPAHAASAQVGAPGEGEGVMETEGGGEGVAELHQLGETEGVVLTEGSGQTTFRTAWLFASETYTAPLSRDTETAQGLLKDAPPPSPFALPAVPVPARVKTAPVAVATVRSVELPLSTSHRKAPEGSSARPCGENSEAPAPLPSASAGTPLPARVVTNPLSDTILILWLLVSLTNALPEASTATPRGELNWATVATPSAHPAAPLPANVETAAVSVTTRNR